MSRPKLSLTEKKNKILTVKLSESEYDLIVTLSRNANMTVSEYLRRSATGSRILDRGSENLYHEVSAVTNLLSRVVMTLKRAYIHDETDKSKLLAALEPAQEASEKAKLTLSLLYDELQAVRALDEEVNGMFNDSQ